MIAEQEILENLRAPIKSFRLFALEEIINGQSSPEILEALQAQIEEESDSECRLMLSYALDAVKARLHETFPVEAAPADPADFPGYFSALSVSEKVSLLSRLSPGHRTKLRDVIPDVLEAEADTLVQARLISTFATVWPKTRLQPLSAALKSTGLALRLVALEALVQLAPDQLSSKLPRLLSSEDPRVRGLAIRGLARIDPSEALRHLDALLRAEDPHQRLAGIRNSFFFPFAEVRDLILGYLSRETDLSLIRKAGLLLENNPDPHVPFKLWEMAEQAPSKPGALLKDILQKAFQAVEKSGILGAAFPEYRRKLQTWLQNRRTTQLVQEILSRIADPEFSHDIEWQAFLQKALAQDSIRVQLQEALSGGIPEPVKEHLQAALAGKAISAAEPLPQIWAGQTADEKIKRLALWGKDDSQEALPHIQETMQVPETPAPLIAAAFRCAQRQGCPDFTEKALRSLSSADANLVSAALEYLGAFDPETAFLHVGKLVQSTAPRIKTAALRLLKSTDMRQALSMLQRMLSGSSGDARQLVFACLVHFDFSQIRDVLISQIETRFDADTLHAAMALFRSNPEPANLYCLYRLEKIVPGEFAASVAAVRNENQRTLIDLRVLSSGPTEKSNAEFEQKWQDEQARKRKPVPAYSLDKLSRQPPAGFAEQIQAVLEKAAATYGIRIPIGFTVALVLLIWVFFGSSSGPTVNIQSPGELLPARTLIIGKVDRIQGQRDIAVLTTDSGLTFEILGRKNEFYWAAPGDHMEVEVSPFRKTPEHVILAHLEAIKSITSINSSPKE